MKTLSLCELALTTGGTKVSSESLSSSHIKQRTLRNRKLKAAQTQSSLHTIVDPSAKAAKDLHQAAKNFGTAVAHYITENVFSGIFSEDSLDADLAANVFQEDIWLFDE